MTAVLVNRRAILPELAGWVAGAPRAVHLITSASSVSDAGMRALAAAGVETVVVDDYDSDQTTRLIEATCRRIGASRLLSTTEIDIQRCAAIRQRIGLPGQSVASANAYRDKHDMKSRVSAAGIATARMALADDPVAVDDLMHRTDRFVLKPVRGVASKQTFMLDTAEELQRVLSHTASRSDYLVEERLDGELFHVDGLMSDGAILQAWPSRYLHQQWQTMYEAKPNLSVMLADGAEADRLVATAREVVDALPAAEGLHAFHAEFFVDADGPVYLGEIASRAGGAGIVEAYEHSFGVNLYAEPIRAGLGLGSSERVTRRAPEALHGWGWFPPREGTLLRAPSSAPTPQTLRYDLLVEPLPRYFDGPHAVTDAVATLLFRRRVTDGSAEDEMTQLLEVERWWNANTEWTKGENR
ncbi:ATP-grasp domain-containing protein [Curtobacterium flaccumfaciens]|uniref:ATP-grasp domain-containing protein n=1 Tax=Curtobacterium flaccumfaciens TaxID=2035 RepID=UPI0011291820|nr:hypothetical protein [Curtobacterium flaccumfaciens]TPG05126.1 hypothetical protein EAH85_14245 [Curtobacterium flaccumfaciens]